MFITMLFENPRTFAIIVLMVVFSVCLHEYMHAYAALKMGDPTAADRGHLTMNPFKQMGWVSLLMLLFIGLAWGQVPVNPYNLETRKKRITVALAGVSANLLLFVVFTLLGYLTAKFSGNFFAAQMLCYGAVLNVVLLIINLLPVPGFDGFKVVMEFFPIRSQQAAERANIACFIVMLLIFLGIDHVYQFAGIAVGTLLNILGAIS